MFRSFHVNAKRLHWWLVSIGTGNGLVPSGNKPRHEPIKFDTQLCGHMAHLGNELIYAFQDPSELNHYCLFSWWVVAYFAPSFSKLIVIFLPISPTEYIVITNLYLLGTLIFHWYRKTSNISRTLVDNKIVDHSDVDGASPVAAPTTSSLYFIDLAPGFNRLSEDNHMTRRKTFAFGDLVRLIPEVLRYLVQWNLSVTTTSKVKFITCDLFSNMF